MTKEGSSKVVKMKRMKIANAQKKEEHPYLETTGGANQFKYFKMFIKLTTKN